MFQKRYYSSSDLRAAGFRSIGDDVQIHEDCNIHGLGNISIGDHVRIDAYVSLIAAGRIDIGSYVHIGSYCHLSAGEGICLGDFSGLSQGVKLYTRSDDYSGEHLTNPCVPPEFTCAQRGPIGLGRHVIVGAGSIVLPGVAIGEGSSVGALSLVIADLPEWGVYFGAPAKRIRQRSKGLLKFEQQLLARQAA
jgi:galactoside O-acetyltransferase